MIHDTSYLSSVLEFSRSIYSSIKIKYAGSLSSFGEEKKNFLIVRYNYMTVNLTSISSTVSVIKTIN